MAGAAPLGPPLGTNLWQALEVILDLVLHRERGEEDDLAPGGGAVGPGRKPCRECDRACRMKRPCDTHSRVTHAIHRKYEKVEGLPDASFIKNVSAICQAAWVCWY